MRIFVTGGTGFIGARLIPALLEEGNEVVLLVRPSEQGRELPGGDQVEVVVGESTQDGDWWAPVASCDAAVNLAGYPVFSRWTPKVKVLLRESRLATTRTLLALGCYVSPWTPDSLLTTDNTVVLLSNKPSKAIQISGTRVLPLSFT